MADKNPQDGQILDLINEQNGRQIDPNNLVSTLESDGYSTSDVIEALQRCIERGLIRLNSEGMVIALRQLQAA